MPSKYKNKDQQLYEYWTQFNHKSDYSKELQDLKLKNGDIVTHCWPEEYGVFSVYQEKGNEKYFGKEISMSLVEMVKKSEK